MIPYEALELLAAVGCWGTAFANAFTPTYRARFLTGALIAIGLANLIGAYT